MMDTSEALKDGRLDEAVASVKDAIRKSPADAKHRSVLFQLYCVQGEWEKASTQLKVVAEMDLESAMWAGVCEKVLACEAERREVFAGKKAATLFGEPPEWVGGIVESFRLGIEGQWEAAATSQAHALEIAPASAATLNGQEIEWVADADSRFGPLLEAYIEGKYYWIPFEHIREINLRARTHLMDSIWAPADFEWLNAGKASGYIPARYFGSEKSADGMIQLGRKTEWQPMAENFYVGLGHRVFAASTADFDLQQLKTLHFNHPEPEATMADLLKTAPASADDPEPVDNPAGG